MLALLTPALAQEPREPVKLVRVVDGDTLRVRTATGQEIRVRLIGIDTPEIHKGDHLERQAGALGIDPKAVMTLGEQASRRAQELTHDQLWLEYDQERKDRYGRTLAYVWLDEDHMLNEALLEEGLATPMAVAPNVRNEQRFKEKSDQARRAGRGIWAKKSAPNPPEERAEEPPNALWLALLIPIGIALARKGTKTRDLA